MHIKIRHVTGKQVVINSSKTDPVEALRKHVEEAFNIPPSKQRLFFQGKQLEDGYTLHNYKINVNDTIQVMEKVEIELKPEEEDTKTKNDEPKEIPCESPYFRVGDVVDACDATHGAYFEGKVIEIIKYSSDEDIYYKVQFSSGPTTPTAVLLKDIRPRARAIVPVSDLKPDDMVMVNHNLCDPDERGFWYDMRVDCVEASDEKTTVKGTLFVGVDHIPADNMATIFPDEIMAIEPNKLLADRTPEELELLSQEPNFKRKTAPLCNRCKDNPRRKCRTCGCAACGGKEEPEKQLVCDECEDSFHIHCLDPPLSELPDCDDWYCKDCKNDDKEVVKAGDKLKESQKKRPSSLTTKKWGGGMACAGKTKSCALVPLNHFGPIPGIEVGSMWLYRIQVSECGVHGPPVGGIHGRANEGAYSIVLSGGYEDDFDYGDEFLYTGSGGRDLSGNKRTAAQSCDQQLTRMNRALALNCAAPLDEKNGAEAKNWKKGKPVRVVRNAKGARHSVYAPKEGNRYDGIYKVVKYFPAKGQSGFNVWRYLLRRDDPVPAPWTEEGKDRISSLGLKMEIPENFQASENSEDLETNKITDKKQAKKRKLIEEPSAIKALSPKEPLKKLKVNYSPSEDVIGAIDSDTANAKVWKSVMEHVSAGQRAFLDKVEEEFTCTCCMGLVYNPVTTICSHNVCEACLKRSYKAQISSCPSCRTELGPESVQVVNENLSKALNLLFPGYQAS